MKHEDILKAAEDARRLLRGFKAFQEVADALEAAGTAVQSKAEAEAALVAARADIDAAKAELSGAKKDIADAKAKAKELREKAEADAAAIVSLAKEQAASIVEAAKVGAQEHWQDKKASADLAVQAAKDAQARRDELQGEVKALEDRLAELRAAAAKIAG